MSPSIRFLKNSLTFFAIEFQYEGLETSPNIFYLGAAPNQQLIPGVKWSYDHLGKTFYLVGSDYVFPRSANSIIKDVIRALGGTVVGEKYILLGSKKVQPVVEDIISKNPNVILNTINGDTNIEFFKELQKRNTGSKKIPVVSFSISEVELNEMKDISSFVGSYAAWNYFQSIQSPENRSFIQRFRNQFGKTSVLGDPLVSAYSGVYLWKEAVETANSFDTNLVIKSIANKSFNSPGGRVYIDHENHHTWKPVYIGKVNKNKQFDIVWSSQKVIRPFPFPRYKSVEGWNQFLSNLYKNWDENWANPRKTD